MRGKGHDQYKKVRKEGGSLVIAVGSLIPAEWKLVKLSLVGRPSEKAVTIKFTKVV